MQITVEINSCNDCRHLSHSGSFTIRGARPTCSHDRAGGIERVTVDEFFAEYPEYKERDGDKVHEHWEWHWIHRVVSGSSEKEIVGMPDWCPLKNGARY